MANRKFQVPVNLVNLVSNPEVAADGDIYYNTADNTLRLYANGAWVNISIASPTNIHASAKLATTTNLSATYTAGSLDQNGGYGIGAILTANANGRGSIDGINITTGDRILVKNQATSTQNGVYTVTTQGAGGAPYVLTRATDFNDSTVNDVVIGDFIYITSGTANASTSWILNYQGTGAGGHTIIGTDAITFAQTGGVGPQGPTGPAGVGGAISNYGSFYSTVDQSATTGGEAVKFDSTNVANGVTLVTNGTSLTRITVPDSGTYMIDFTGQLALTGAGDHTANFWLKKNGTSAASTAFDSTLKSSTPTLTSWVWQVNATAGDYYEIFWNADSTNVFLNSVVALSPVPAAAGAFVRVTQVNYQGLSGVVNVTSPITNSGTSTSAQLGFDDSTFQKKVTNVSDTEIGYLDGVTSAIQTQIDGKSSTSHNHTLNSLSNVVVTSPTDGQAIVWDTTTSKWINETVSGGGGSSTLDGLTDVTIDTPADNEVLAYDTSTSQWINQTASEAGLATTAGKLSQFASTTSAELAGVISDETGFSTGAKAVFSIAPVIGDLSVTTPYTPQDNALTINGYGKTNLIEASTYDTDTPIFTVDSGANIKGGNQINFGMSGSHYIAPNSNNLEVGGINKTSLILGSGTTPVTVGGSTGSVNLRGRVYQQDDTVITKTATFTIDGTGNVSNTFACNSASTITITLPTANSWIGRQIKITNRNVGSVISASSNVIPRGSGTAGTAILPANVSGAWAILQSSGGSWYVIADSGWSSPTFTGTVQLGTAATIAFEGATSDAFDTTLTVVDPTANRTITLPNATGTVALTSDLSSYAALSGATFTGDIAVNGGDITTTSTTATLYNSNATTVQIGHAATTLSIGDIAHTGTTTINNDLAVYGTITFSQGASSLSATTINIDDTMISLADNNTADILDIGFYAGYRQASTNYHTGLVRDASDSGKWKLFSGVSAQPTGTVDFTSATYDTLVLGSLELSGNITGGSTLTAFTTTNNLTLGKSTGYTGANATNNIISGGSISDTTGANVSITDNYSVRNLIATGGNARLAAQTINIGTGTLNYSGVDSGAILYINVGTGSITNGTKNINIANVLNIQAGSEGYGSTFNYDVTIPTLYLTNALAYNYGGTGLTTLGAAGQVLKVNAGATALEWGTVSSGSSFTNSAGLAGLMDDETGFSTGAKAVFSISPAISTSITTASTSFDLLNTTATTLNIGGAATTISMGATTGTTTIRNNLALSEAVSISASKNIAVASYYSGSFSTGRVIMTGTGSNPTTRPDGTSLVAGDIWIAY